MNILSDVKVFGGRQIQFEHNSSSLNCTMKASIYLPPAAETKSVPVLYWLSGLTCTDQNFVTKAGAQRVAAELGLAIICPDTSPRGDNVPDDADSAWDFGLGAGFYVDATENPWKEHYQMYSYVIEELPNLVNQHFSVNPEKASISGHSMGGHGALTIALKNADKYVSASAFSPIVSPMNCPWGTKALANYLGEDRESWRAYDACELIKSQDASLPLLIDQGLDDSFLQEQLRTELLEVAASESNLPIKLRYHDGYDHSYFFIASFIDQHLRFHHQYLMD